MKVLFATLLLLSYITYTAVPASATEGSTSILESFRLATFNIRNYGATFERRRGTSKTNHNLLYGMIAELNADIIAVQEIVGGEEFKSFIATYFPQYDVLLTRCGGGLKQKVGLVYDRRKLVLETFHEDLSIKSRSCNTGVRPMLMGHFRDVVSGHRFIVATVHLKAKGDSRSVEIRHRQIKRIGEILRAHQAEGHSDVILMGDFNTTEYIAQGPHYYHFLDFIEGNDLLNLTSDSRCTSYWSGGINDGISYPSVLDHIIISNNFSRNFTLREVTLTAHCRRATCNATATEYLSPYYNEVSDHCPLVVSLK